MDLKKKKPKVPAAFLDFIRAVTFFGIFVAILGGCMVTNPLLDSICVVAIWMDFLCYSYIRANVTAI